MVTPVTMQSDGVGVKEGGIVWDGDGVDEGIGVEVDVGGVAGVSVGDIDGVGVDPVGVGSGVGVSCLR